METGPWFKVSFERLTWGLRLSILHQENPAYFQVLHVNTTTTCMTLFHPSFLFTKIKTKTQRLHCNLHTLLNKCSFRSYIGPLDYGSSVWDPPGVVLQEELESVQKRAVTFVTGNYSHETGSMTGILTPGNVVRGNQQLCKWKPYGSSQP